MLSIVTPVLNGGKFLRKNILSVMKLNIPYEHIIVDGGSDDNSIDIVKEYPHLKLIFQKGNGGMYEAIHQGFLATENRYITWVNCDDTILSNNYSQTVIMALENKYDLVYGDAYINEINNKKKYYHKANRFAKIFLKKGILPFVQPSSFYAKSLYVRTPLRFEKFRISGDLDFFSRMVLGPHINIHYTNKPMSVFLKHGDSLGDRNTVLSEIERNKYLISPTLLDRIFFKISKYM